MTNPIKFFIISLIFSSLYFTKVYAQKENKSLLYEISGNGLAQPSYLYGTIHAICKNDFVMTESTKKAFSESQQIYLELDMDDPQMMTEMQKNLMMTDGSTLKTLLSESDYQKVNTFFKDSLKTNITMFEQMKPFVLSSFTIPKMLNCPMQGYEEVFVKMASEEHKEVLGLETVQEQFAAIDKMGMKKQAEEMLVQLITNWNEGKAELKKLIADYKKQDVDLMMEDMANSKFSNDGFEKDILETRNQNWISRIAKISKEKSTFFAVGAGHLGGSKGVIALLKKEGYIVKTVK